MPNRELLSLLPVFNAIFSELSLSRAAERLGVTQSAVSQSLARLRQLTGDELFESTGRGMRPSPRAMILIRHVRAALAETEALLTRRELDIKTIDRTFIIETGAGFDMLWAASLYTQLAAAAPHAKLQLAAARNADPASSLRAGDAELVFDIAPTTASDLRSQLVSGSPLVVISRPEHPEIRGTLTEQQYLSLGHVTLNWGRAVVPSTVAMELKRFGKEVRSVVNLPTLSGMGAVVAASDLIATISERVARELACRYPLAIHRMPISLPDAQLFQVWHARHDGDLEHQWLRSLVARAVIDVDRILGEKAGMQQGRRRAD